MWIKQIHIKKQKILVLLRLPHLSHRAYHTVHMMTVSLNIIARPEVRLSNHMCIGYFSAAMVKKKNMTKSNFKKKKEWVFGLKL